MVTFIAIVVILIIILVFILGSGVIKKMAGNEKGVRVLEESDVGIENVLSYLDNYFRLMEVKVFVVKGQSFEDARREAGYVE